MKLNELIQNPDNPSYASDEEIANLAKKLERVPDGLKANRIAYVVENGVKMILAGNKRWQALCRIHGKDADVPDEWFQDITSMSESERHEFIITSNVNDGWWDLDKLIDRYSAEEMQDYGIGHLLDKLPKTNFDNIDIDAILTEKPKATHTYVCQSCGKEFTI